MMTYELTASDLKHLPVSSVGHCCVCSSEHAQISFQKAAKKDGDLKLTDFIIFVNLQ